MLGANGAGKTTTLRAISNTVHRDGGEVRFGGATAARRPGVGRPPRRRARARRTRNVRRADRVGEPAPRRVHAARQPEGRLRPRPHVLPVARGAPLPARGDAQRRRAADARARARVHAAAAPSAPRRAVARSRAAARHGGLPDRQGAERERGPHGARRRAERAHRAPARADGVRSRSRHAWRSPARAPSCNSTSPSAGATSGTDGRRSRANFPCLSDASRRAPRCCCSSRRASSSPSARCGARSSRS